MAEIIHAYQHPKATRKNLPTDQTERFMEENDYEEQSFAPEKIDNTNYPVLQWNRTEQQEFEHGPLYIHEKILPAVLIQSALKDEGKQLKLDLFSQFNGMPDEANYDWYQFDGYWQNRMIHGDGKRVMASLAEREGLAGKVQTVYMDPPYNIKFNANFQLKTDEIEVGESGDELPHDPMAVKAFRDAYSGNIHTFLDNLHQQMTLARELLTESGNCFVQIGYENIHEVACLMNEVFGKENHVATIPYTTATNQSGRLIPQIGSWIVWFAKNKQEAKYRQLFKKLDRKETIALMSGSATCETPEGICRGMTKQEKENPDLIPKGTKIFQNSYLYAKGSNPNRSKPFKWNGKTYQCPRGEHWRVDQNGLEKLAEKNRLSDTDTRTLHWKRYEEEIPGYYLNANWSDIGYARDRRYIVQSPDKTVERCILMTTDPGDLVLDPTCGSGTTAYVAEKWGRRWITIDTSRVAIAVARQRLATSKFDYFLLQDSDAGAKCESKLAGAQPIIPSGTKDVSKGFVYPRIPRVSAATLAYGIEEYIYIVDQPERNAKKTRVCSPFTVESDSRAAALRTDEEIKNSVQESPTRDQILEALPIAGVRYGNDHWAVTELESHPHTSIVTHIATILERKSGKKLRAGIYIAPEDTATSPNHIRQAVREVPNMIPKRDALLIISFAYEAPATAGEYQNMGSVQIIRAEANKDLTIPGLKNSPDDNSFVVVGEPDAEIRKAPNGQLELEVHGVDTYDPKINSVRPGEVKDIHCIMTDTDFDGLSFKVRRINFPNQTKDRQLERMKRDLQKYIDDQKWNRLMTAVTIPFDPPESGQIAVKVIDKAGMETMRVLDTKKEK